MFLIIQARLSCFFRLPKDSPQITSGIGFECNRKAHYKQKKTIPSFQKSQEWGKNTLFIIPYSHSHRRTPGHKYQHYLFFIDKNWSLRSHKTMGLFQLSFLPVLLPERTQVKVIRSSALRNRVLLVKVLRSLLYDGCIDAFLSFTPFSPPPPMISPIPQELPNPTSPVTFSEAGKWPLLSISVFSHGVTLTTLVTPACEYASVY